MKKLLFLILIMPLCSFAQKGDPAAPKLGPHPVIIVDSVRLTHEQFMDFDPNTIASLTVLTDTDATNHYGPDAKDGVALIQTRAFARKHYIAFLRKKSHAYDSLYTVAKSDSTFQYIINDKIQTGNFEGNVAMLDDWLFISLTVLTEEQLKTKYNITGKKVGILIEAKRPQNLFNWDKKF